MDMKGIGIQQLTALVQMKKLGIVPPRDIVFAATCDEETGGAHGVKWLVANHWDKLNPAFVMDEGGFGSRDLLIPNKLAFGIAFNAPVAAIAGGAALVSLFVGKDKLRMPSDPPVILLGLFVLWMCLTTAFAFDPAGSLEQLVKVLKILLMVGVAFAAIQSRKHIELLIWVCVLSLGYYGAKGGVFTLMTGGGERVWGPPGGFIEENNSLAVALVMTIPMINYLDWCRRA